MTVFEGNTVDAAIAAGLKAMRTTRDQVTVTVVAEPKKGFLGIGKRPARVQLTTKPASAVASSAPASAQPVATTAAQSQATASPQPLGTVKAATQPTPKSQAAPAKHTHADQPTSAAAHHHQAQAKSAHATTPAHPHATHRSKAAPKVAKMPKTIKADKAAKGTQAAASAKENKGAKTKSGAQTEPVRSPEEIAARQAANEQAVRDLSAYLLEIVKQLGITADLDVDFGNRHALLNFDTAKQGLLIGKHGRTINALQDLAQVYMNHHGASHVNVVLDVDDYRDRREATLKRLAESTAREAIATGKQVFLDPMPSFERKLIHAELANNRHVTTFSEGRDPHRAVVVAVRK